MKRHELGVVLAGYIAVAAGVVLALSLAGNALMFHERDKVLAAKAMMEQLQRDTVAAAGRCNASVKDLGDKSARQNTQILAAVRAVVPAVKEHQEDAILSLAAMPGDNADLCGSLLEFWRERLPLKAEP